MNIKLNHFKHLKTDEKVSFLLIILLPISLTSGSLIPDLIVTISSIIFFYKIFNDLNFFKFLSAYYKKNIFVYNFLYNNYFIFNKFSIYTNSFLASFLF